MILLSASLRKDVTNGILLKLFLGFGGGPWKLALYKAFEIIWSGYLLFFSRTLNSFSLNSTFSELVTKTKILLATL